MFSRIMSYRDIRGHVEDMYGIDVSEATITGVTDCLIPDSNVRAMRSIRLSGSMQSTTKLKKTDAM